MRGETKTDRFARVAEKRVQRVLDSLRSLSQCANPRMYEWRPEQTEKMWRAIEQAMDACRNKFDTARPDEFRF